MLRLIIRKLVLMLVLLPLLNAVGFYYAVIHPRLFVSPTGVEVETSTSGYGSYLLGLLAGDLGRVGNQQVASVIANPVKNSLILLVTALVVAVIFGLLLGLLSISPRTKRIAPQALLLLAAGSSMPGFLAGGMILSFMVYQTLYAGNPRTLLPLSGFGLDEHLILPVVVLALQPTMYIAKVTAGLVENELQQDYIRVARSKGLSWLQLLWLHALPNMLAPVLVTIGESMRLMVGALVIVEALFIWPGIGRIFLFTIGLRLDARPPGVYFGNPELLAAIVVILGVWILLADLIASALSYWVDPRLGRASEQVDALLA
ncbi:MAG TPA: ABC transporter permease [Anaerolineae bacterium]